MKAKLLSPIILIALSTLNSCNTENAVTSDGLYFPKVKAIIQANCTVTCHAPSKGFYTGLPVVLESDSNIVSLAASIKAAVADPISPTNKRMPQGGALSATDIDTITKWLAKGGKATD
jgi:uncharacterized membrane protein